MERFDNWANSITSVGARGRSSFSHVAGIILSPQDLESLFYEDAFASRIVKEPVEEALRRGWTLKVTPNDDQGDLGSDDIETAATIKQWLDAMHVTSKCIETWTWARLFGGGALLIGADDGLDPKEPLDLTRIQSVDYVVSVDSRDLYPIEWFRDPRKPNFGEPRIYQLTRQGGSSVDTHAIHASRLIRFDGALTNRRRRFALASWSESELKRVYTALQKFNGAYEAVGTLLQESSQGVFGVKDLYEAMASDNGNTLKKRLELMDISRSVARSILIDKDEESFERVEVGALTGLPDVMRTFMLFLAGASGIPVTILMGQAPAGLAATGDADIRMYYDRIASARENYLKPKLVRLCTILCSAQNGPTGGIVPRFDIHFPSMYAPTFDEEGAARLQMAQADQIYLAAGVCTPEEIATSRFPSSGWSMETTIDQDVRRATTAAAAVPGGPDPEAATMQKDDITEISPTAPFPPKTMAAIATIVAQVGSRTIPRSAGVQMLTLLGLSPEKADELLGETGTTEFTTLAPEALKAQEELQAQHAALNRSLRSYKTMLAGVLAKNKAGQLVTGSPIGQKTVPEGPPFTGEPTQVGVKLDDADLALIEGLLAGDE